jgi:hypothetical protein
MYMPFVIKLERKGFKVCDTKGKCFSKKPLTKKTATRQRIALALSESRRTGKPVGEFFGEVN